MVWSSRLRKLCKLGMKCMTLNGGCVAFHPSALSHYLGGEFHNCILHWNIYSAHGISLQHIEFQGFFISANFLFLVSTITVCLSSNRLDLFHMHLIFIVFFPFTSLHLLSLIVWTTDLFRAMGFREGSLCTSL